MSLSLDKFQKLLSTYSLIPIKYYTYHDRVLLVEVVSLSSAEPFLLYISKEYNFKPDTSFETYNLKRIHLDEKGDVPAKYASKLDDLEMDEYYSKVNLLNTEKMLDKTIDIEKELIDEYRKRILVTSSEESTTMKVRDMVNQLQRLERCVDSKDYSLSIMTNSLIVLDPEHMFIIRGKDLKEHRMYIIVVTIETLFKNVNYIAKDIPELNNGIQRILMKNHQSHMEKMDDTIDGMIQVQDKLHATMNRIDRYNSYIARLTDLLEKVKQKEISVRNARKVLHDKIAGGIDKEIYHLKEKESIEKDEKWVSFTKGKIYEKVLDLHKKTRNHTLMMDKLLFENLVMMISIQRNMSTL